MVILSNAKYAALIAERDALRVGLETASEVLEELCVPTQMYGMAITDPEHPWCEHARVVNAALNTPRAD